MDNDSVNATETDIAVSTVGIGIFIVSGAIFLICLWIIILNGLLILCFLVNKRESWFSHSKNILSIIIIDLLVGLTTLLAFVASMKIDMNLYECLFSMSLCLASQTATSLNVLRFCVTRFVSIRKTSVAQEPSALVVVAQSLAIWVASSAIVLVPLVLWSEKQPTLQRCQWSYLFESNEATVDLYMFNVLTIPTVTTTVLYGILTIKLRKVRNFVHPTSTEAVAPSKDSHNSGSDTKTTLVLRKTTIQDAPSASGKLSDGNDAKDSYQGCNADVDQDIDKHNKPVQLPLKPLETISGKISTNANQITSKTTSNKLTAPNIGTKPVVTANRMTRMNKVLATIGVLLVLINISNLPFIVILALIAINPAAKVPALIGLLAMLSLMLNSACNPIIYAVRLKPLRHAFLNMYRNCCNAMYKMLCCKN